MDASDDPDVNPFKNFTIVPVPNNAVMRFTGNTDIGEVRRKEKFVLEVVQQDGTFEHHYLTGNAYVLNESGKTIASHGAQ
jgi:hypothetical protein